jgi:dienelactone hydrolase
MRFRQLPSLLALLSFAAFAQSPPVYFSVPPADAPELAARGAWSVGVRTIDLVNPGQPDILHFDAASGKAPLYDRPLKIEIWYPATIPAGQKEHTIYETPLPHSQTSANPRSFSIAGKALRDAPPVSGERFPLVIVSHGFPGSRTFLSYLTENLASKGYIVAAIDHTDSVFGQENAFTATLLNRANDQWFTIDALAARALVPTDFLHGMLDSSRIAIVGYSMGGYGALASAGAGYSKQGGAARLVPGGYLDSWIAGNPAFTARRRASLKALVAIAPWGAQPPHNNWDAPSLAGITVPSLFIAGDHDDVSGFEAGTKKVFDGAVNSERYLLVYQNARHNVGGNPPPDEALGSFTTRQFFDEPVWRKDRITSINQHFITAFLDLYLKGDESRRAYLDSSWKGFQKRWALGLELHHHVAGPAAAPSAADWGPLQFLVGNWSGDGGGQPGQGSGTFSFTSDLQGGVLVRKSFAEYPAGGGKPASRHDDLTIVYRDQSSHSLRANYFDNEGHAIPYTIAASADGAVFISEASPSTPRFRLTYTSTAPDALRIKFEIAPPGKEFSIYLEASAHRDSTPAASKL